MDAKVSIVIAVYNKAPYLDAMLESVLKQQYRNIEAIIVNDGSTDGSLGIIRKWEPVFTAAGLEMVVIEQANSGVAAAIKTGLRHTGGEFVCFPDADDELMPDYVSSMVEAIGNHYDYVICGLGARNRVNGEVEPFYLRIDKSENKRLLERYLLSDIANSLYTFLIRLQYLKKYNIIENIITVSRISQEPQLIIPTLFYSQKMTVIHRVLYVYNTYAQALGKTHIDDPLNKVLVEYHDAQAMVIHSLDTSDAEKRRLTDIAKIGNLFHAHTLLKDKSKIYEKTVETLHEAYPNLNAITLGKVVRGGMAALQAAVCGKVLRRRRKSISVEGQVIAFGSLGQVAVKLLPFLEGTPLWPGIFFDQSAGADSRVFDGSKVITTDESLVGRGDVLLCLPKIRAVEEYVASLADRDGAVFLNYFEIIDYLADWYYPEITQEGVLGEAL